ncbi:MAG TPA: AlkA N-terminal domain-containing protein [Gemmatimonadaceae bacterium]|nr:AlkA N-terminal domain-containing protein [Gemmatimonadaceae bacterium]
MIEDTAALYNAYASRDPRFDGVFYIGVTSTGIYCRPVCTARTPRAANCRFFDSAEAAESASFRPCLRCRPELAPGLAPVDDARRIASLLVHRIDEGTLASPLSGTALPLMEQVAKQFGWSSRQIRRIVKRELGVSPMELLQTRRLLLAKQLLTETVLPIAEVAHASGYASLRRFNDAFSRRYGMPPTRFRTDAPRSASAAAAGTLTLRLGYRPPFDWTALLDFLRARQTVGVEHVTDVAYMRTVRLGARRGWIEVRNDESRHALRVTLANELAPVLPALLGRLRNLFDLAARPDVIRAHLARDRALRASVEARPGLRVPGAFDGFELAARAILGQQITVKAATTLAGRLAAAFGEPIETPHPQLVRLSPTATRLRGARARDLSALGVMPARAATILAVAAAIDDGLALEPGADAETSVARLTGLPGIGSWTAHYIAMRALRWTDAFPREDVVIRRQLGGVSGAEAEQMSQAWRPWRSYATMHLWGALG